MKLKFGLFIGLLVATLLGNKVIAQQTESKYGEDSVQCVMNNSLYYEFY